MANTYNLIGILAYGTHAARPAASAVATGTLYSETDTGYVYQSNGSSWVLWSSGTGAAASIYAAANFR